MNTFKKQYRLKQKYTKTVFAQEKAGKTVTAPPSTLFPQHSYKNNPSFPHQTIGSHMIYTSIVNLLRNVHFIELYP